MTVTTEYSEFRRFNIKLMLDDATKEEVQEVEEKLDQESEKKIDTQEKKIDTQEKKETSL